MNNIIIDIEFNGLFRYNFIPEIIQVKLFNLTNNKKICFDFKTKNNFIKNIYNYNIGVNSPYYFNKTWFKAMLKLIGGSIDDNFYGFSIKSDKQMLLEYNIEINNYFDIQEQLMLLDKYEKAMACGGRSLENCYFLVTGKIIDGEHNSINEIKYIYMLYKEAYINNSPTREYLTVFPWGEQAGMPIVDYVHNYRKKADGYRFNNSDLLAKSLDDWLEPEQD